MFTENPEDGPEDGFYTGYVNNHVKNKKWVKRIFFNQGKINFWESTSNIYFYSKGINLQAFKLLYNQEGSHSRGNKSSEYGPLKDKAQFLGIVSSKNLEYSLDDVNMTFHYKKGHFEYINLDFKFIKNDARNKSQFDNKKPYEAIILNIHLAEDKKLKSDINSKTFLQDCEKGLEEYCKLISDGTAKRELDSIVTFHYEQSSIVVKNETMLGVYPAIKSNVEVKDVKEAEGSQSTVVSENLVKKLEAFEFDLSVPLHKADQQAEEQSHAIQHQYSDFTKMEASGLTTDSNVVVSPKSPIPAPSFVRRLSKELSS